MTIIAFLRHGPTAWNAETRIQGTTDIPLSDPLSNDGRMRMAQYRLPPPFDTARCRTSPLSRARETARLVGAMDPVEDAHLIEMNWGAWTGETIKALRARLGDTFLGNEARGLDFRAEGGETPREVATRVTAFAADMAQDDAPVIAVTHKGVIRAALALGTNWDMRGRAPVKLEWRALHVFRAERNGNLSLVAANTPLIVMDERP